MEDLTKQQLVLLALLVSFVTSIATGIATVALIEQAPQEVREPVFQVVERTVERVVPAQVASPAVSERAVIESETVIVKEQDAITSAIDKARKALVQVYSVNMNRSGRITDRSYRGVGVLVATESGTRVVSFSDNVLEDTFGTHELVFSDNATALTSGTTRSEDETYATFTLSEGSVIPNTLTPLQVVAFSDVSLGQSVLSLGGEKNTTISSGIVSALLGEERDVRVGFAAMDDGAPLINLFGAVIGFAGSKGESIFHSAENID